MTDALAADLKKLKARAFDRAGWAHGVLQAYHAARGSLSAERLAPVQRLYQWMFVPTILWPFDIQQLLSDCLAALEGGKRLTSQQRLLIELLPEPPGETVCAVVAEHEHHLQKGSHEYLLSSSAKYAQNELGIQADGELQRQWRRIKAAFDVRKYCDHKGVIRRTMSTERNLHPARAINLRRRAEVFQAAFDAFCLRWNLYGMQDDEPLLLKLAVTLTPYGTMIHIPAYWSFDPKRDIRWAEIARLHRARVAGRQGAALAEGRAERMRAARKLRQLDREAARRGLKGDRKHAFLCAGLGWDERTSPKRLSRLRAEFKTASGR
jgi:hypothetical protein